MAYINKSKSDSWGTPVHLREQLSIRFGPFSNFDPCPLGGADDDSVEDGLSYDWPTTDGAIYVNPPYSRLGSSKKTGIGWMEKCLQQSRRGVTVVALVPLRSPKWYQQFVAGHADEYRVFGRIKFNSVSRSTVSTAPFDCVIYVWRYGETPPASLSLAYGAFVPHESKKNSMDNRPVCTGRWIRNRCHYATNRR